MAYGDKMTVYSINPDNVEVYKTLASNTKSSLVALTWESLNGYVNTIEFKDYRCLLEFLSLAMNAACEELAERIEQ